MIKRNFRDDGVWTHPDLGLNLTRNQRRQVRKNAGVMDRTTSETDRRFFARFPHREFRIRLPGQAEVDQNHILSGRGEAAPGFRRFVIVRHVAPGTRFKMLAPIRIGCGYDDLDLSEREIAALWAEVTAPYPQIGEAVEAFRQAEGQA